MSGNGPATRDTLYEEVWTEPMTKVAARYGVSSSFLARACTRMNVPRPERDHWAKLAVGKAPKQPPLSDDDDARPRLRLLICTQLHPNHFLRSPGNPRLQGILLALNLIFGMPQILPN